MGFSAETFAATRGTLAGGLRYSIPDPVFEWLTNFQQCDAIGNIVASGKAEENFAAALQPAA
jgi:hypothetical protein